jgi:fused signal recognition particle receptor
MVGNALKRGLAKTRNAVLAALSGRVGGEARTRLDLDQLEDALLSADLGPQLSNEVAERVLARLKGQGHSTPVADVLSEELARLMPAAPPVAPGTPLHTVLMVGVNGCGKTTTVAKLARLYRRAGRSVMVAAADTFRAAAAEQIELLAERAGARVVRHRSGADPASVVHDCLTAALAKGIDVVLVDTGGRLQTRSDLMDELEKISRVMGKVVDGAPHEVLLVLDATTGQNALSQAEEFHRRLGLTGVVIAKLDGTAKGGAVLAVGRKLGVGVRYVGLGEALEDIESFDPVSFAQAMVGDT